MPARFTSIQKCALDRLTTGIESFKTNSPRHHRFLTTFYASVGDQFTSLFGQLYFTGVEEYNPVFFSKLHNTIESSCLPQMGYGNRHVRPGRAFSPNVNSVFSSRLALGLAVLSVDNAIVQSPLFTKHVRHLNRLNVCADQIEES